MAISRRSCAGMAKKCTKKRDARACKNVVLLVNSIAFFDVPLAVAVVS